MSKFRVDTEKIMDEGKEGGIKFQLVAKEKMLAMFDKRERNAILAESFRKMGQRWVERWLPLRFTKYAYTLGYDVSDKYYQYKKRYDDDPQPLVGPPQVTKLRTRKSKANNSATTTYGNAPGDKTIVQAQNANSRATAPNGMPSVTIRIPTGHPIAAIVGATLKTLPPHEIKDLATYMGETLAALINGADTPEPGKMKLTRNQRSALDVGRKSSASAAKFSRAKVA